VVDLSGAWPFTPLNGSATPIQVPGGSWYKQGYTSISEADYQRTITVPNIGQPQITRIEFGAVNNQATLHINEVPQDTNTTSFPPLFARHHSFSYGGAKLYDNSPSQGSEWIHGQRQIDRS
jgi:hypothetical protein